MKHEWKKHEKENYGAKAMPALCTQPRQQYLIIDGTGSPNAPDFSERVGVLYSLAYAVKIAYKKEAVKKLPENGINDFSVYPLEGIWQQNEGVGLIKENLKYTIMLRQPDFITAEQVAAALQQTKRKKPSPLLEEVRFDSMEDGLCVQMLHLGSYDDEPHSFAQMDAFATENGLVRAQSWHREIYLNNASRTDPAKLKTILRFCVKN